MSKNRVYWFCQIVGWSVFGFANIFTYSVGSQRFNALDVTGELFQILYYIFSTHFLRYNIKKSNWVSIAPVKLIPKVLLTTVLLGLSNYVFMLIVTYFLGILIPAVEFRALNILFGLVGPATMYFLWSLIYFAYHYFEQYNKSLQYEAVINEIELNHLKSQLNPHFIFNALNSIRGLVDENPMKCKSAITKLSNILRNSLMMDKKRLIGFNEEMATVKDYLELETIRYEERLKVKIDVNEDVNSCKIPPMMLQTLVENGIKHGISVLKDGGEISIGATVNDENMTIQIRNSGQYINGKKYRPGYGMSNTRKRLELIYGASAQLRILNESDNVVLTEVSIPIIV